MSLGTLGSFHGMCGAESEYSVAHLMFKQVVQRALAIDREVRGPVEGRRGSRKGLEVQGGRMGGDASFFVALVLTVPGNLDFGRLLTVSGLCQILKNQLFTIRVINISSRRIYANEYESSAVVG